MSGDVAKNVQGPARVPRRPIAVPLLYAKGVAMGLGDSVPGVSGGTIAVITNIYERLINAIRSIDLHACSLLFRGRVRDCWQHIDGSFLLVLAVGIVSGLLVSANSVLFLLENYFEPLMALFSGLVLASAVLLRDEFNYRHWHSLLAILGGVMVALAVGMISPRTVDVGMAYLFFSGMIAICAMILPGLSGAFLLLMLGVYEYILTALVQFNVLSILVFSSGCCIGLLSFSRVLAWSLRRYHQLSYGIITGMLLGSLTLLWPWQQTVSTYVDSSGVIQPLQRVNVWPLNYTKATENEPLLLASALTFLIGIAVVFLLRWVFSETTDDHS